MLLNWRIGDLKCLNVAKWKEKVVIVVCNACFTITKVSEKKVP